MALLLLGSGAAIAGASGSGASRSSRPVARAAQSDLSAAGIAQSLLEGAASYAGGKGFGWVLGQYGLDDGINSQIEGIKQRLDAIDVKLQNLSKDLSQGIYSILVGQATEMISNINQGTANLNFIAGMNANDPTKKALTQQKLKFIGDKLFESAQRFLANQITGIAGADGLIAAAYKKEKDHSGRFWTRANSQSVRKVFDYFQGLEAQLLLLRVEYMHAYPGTYNRDYVKAQIEEAKGWLSKQTEELLKPATPQDVIVDPRTRQEWLWSDLFAKVTPAQAKNEADATGRGFHLPTPDQVRVELIDGWQGRWWVDWLNDRIGHQLNVTCCFAGVWTSHWTLMPGDEPQDQPYYIVTNVDEDGKRHEIRQGNYWWDKMGVFLVRPQQQEYW